MLWLSISRVTMFNTPDEYADSSSIYNYVDGNESGT